MIARRATLIASFVALGLAGCANEPEGPPAPTTTSSSPHASPSASPNATVERWIAVIEVARDPSDLDGLTRRLLERLGPALVVSPTDCFERLPDAAGDGYLIGAVGDSRAQVERAVQDAGEHVGFSAEVTVVCTD